jgi:acetoin utilization deacetylase AcuC-like enzyme
MKIYYSDVHTQHNPPFEYFDGGKEMPYLEMPERMQRVLAALQSRAWTEILPPQDYGLEPILTVHDPSYVEFLRTAYDEWLRQENPQAPVALMPATFPPRRWMRKPKSVLGQAGYYQFDLSAPITPGTFPAAYSAAQSALSGAEAIAESDSAAFALCRPPGHHAGKDFAGGYCYLNNAAIAAQQLSAAGRVAILDIDYHAGNGTQDIFYERDDVLTLSIHADPDFEYPHFCGFADESGAGPGAGFHLNYPLPAGTDDAAYLSTLEAALGQINGFRPKFLVVSAGMDLYGGDRLGKFRVTRQGIAQIGIRIAELNLPTLVVMEGGYNNEALGQNMVALLEAFI